MLLQMEDELDDDVVATTRRKVRASEQERYLKFVGLPATTITSSSTAWSDFYKV